MKNNIFLIAVMLIGVQVLAQQTTIKGNVPSYTGEKIVFTKNDDPFTNTEQTIGEAVVNANGNFSVQLNIEKTSYVFADLGYYKGSMYAEKGEEYVVSFPPKKEIPKEDKLNPYFTPTSFYIVPLNTDSTGLNKQIIQFDGAYNSYVNKHFQLLYLKQFKPQLERHISGLDSVYESKNPYFEQYKKYKFGNLRYAAYMRDENKIAEAYFFNQPVQYNLPPYIQFFRQIFENYFASVSQTPLGKEITQAIEQHKSFDKLSNTLAKQKGFENDTLRELLIFSSLFDAYYANTYSVQSIIAVTTNAIRSTNIEYHKTIAQNLKSKFEQLLPGFPAPLFTLPNRNEQQVALINKRGKFVYLNFCNTTSFACIEQLKLMKAMHNDFKEQIDFITISTDENFDEMVELADKDNYDWDFLSYIPNKSIVDKYKVVAYPTYYLIDPEGNLAMSPAPSPKENFGERFFKIWNNRRIKEMQNKDKEDNTKKDNKDRKQR